MIADFRKIGLAVLMATGLGAAHAVPVTYQFTAYDFVSYYGGAIPNTSLSGNITIDGTTVTGIDLTIGSHSYTAAEVDVDSSTTNWTVGGVLNDVNTIAWGTDDFSLVGDFSTSAPAFVYFAYAVSGAFDGFYTTLGSPTGSLSVVNNAPEPATLAVFGIGLAGLGFSRRKKA